MRFIIPFHSLSYIYESFFISRTCVTSGKCLTFVRNQEKPRNLTTEGYFMDTGNNDSIK